MLKQHQPLFCLNNGGKKEVGKPHLTSDLTLKQFAVGEIQAGECIYNNRKVKIFDYSGPIRVGLTFWSSRTFGKCGM